MSTIPRDTLHRRLRNRIIEHLQLVSSAAEQLEYQRAVPIAHVSNELFNSWGDWVPDEATIDRFSGKIFSGEEQLAIREFNSVLETVASLTTDNLPEIGVFVGTAAWRELSSAASKALAIFLVRGMMHED